MAISVTMVASNCIFLDYSIEAAVRSSLTFADEVVINEGMSFDNTYEVLLNLQKEFGEDVVRIYRREWLHDRGWQERERNFAIDQTKGDWIVIQDADDCFHENDAELIKTVCSDDRINLINFEVLHFYGLPCFTNPNPQWYHRHTRMGRKRVDFRIKNTPGGCVSDVCAGGRPCHTYKGSDIVYMPKESPIYHYGWTRDARVAGIKLKKFKGWYADDKKYFDGYLDEEIPFDYQLEKFKKNLDIFTGSHPAPIYDWFISKNRLIRYNPEEHTDLGFKTNPTIVGPRQGLEHLEG